MFDVGFSELMVVGVVALVVIGPERMPGVARTVGALFGRAQRYVNQLKTDIQSEMDLEEFNRIKSTFYEAAESVEHSVNAARQELDATAASLNASMAAQFETPAAVAAEEPITPAQMDFWLDSAPTAGPPAAPGT
jgi:sec-independent protein translocase protein TatB